MSKAKERILKKLEKKYTDEKSTVPEIEELEHKLQEDEAEISEGLEIEEEEDIGEEAYPEIEEAIKKEADEEEEE
jgi:hypothetical protein